MGGKRGLFQSYSSSLSILVWLLQWNAECLGGTVGAGENDLERSPRLFPLFSIVRISNQPCVPDTPDSIGTCFTNNQCRNAGGVTSGVCASGFGVCCVLTATCGSTVTQNNTNIRTRTYPDTFQPNGLENCNVRLQRPNANVCQVRLEFTQLELTMADTTSGMCMADRLIINGVNGVPPNLCGVLTGQHMYLDFVSSDRINLNLMTDGTANQGPRNWNIRTTFIECTSLLRAPDGCLQYYTAATGQVRMLGYPMIAHLQDLEYTVCVRSEDGAGAIVWSPCQGEPLAQVFSMSGDATAAAGMAGAAGMCMFDYVLIMSNTLPTDATMPAVTDRYCGTAFAVDTATPQTIQQMVRSTAKPFIMRVKTDNSEPATDLMNAGFCLAFRQEPPSANG